MRCWYLCWYRQGCERKSRNFKLLGANIHYLGRNGVRCASRGALSRSRGSSRSASTVMAGAEFSAWMSARPRTAFLRRLARRGLRGVKLVISGRLREHQGRRRQGAERHVAALPGGGR